MTKYYEGMVSIYSIDSKDRVKVVDKKSGKFRAVHLKWLRKEFEVGEFTELTRTQVKSKYPDAFKK